MINDHTVKDIRKYIEKLSGYSYFNILKVEDFILRKKGKLRYYYLIEITISRAEHISKLLKCGLIEDDTMIRKSQSTINASINLYIEQLNLRDF
jgi:hypothetical protein